MRKLILILIVLSLSFSMVACSRKTEVVDIDKDTLEMNKVIEGSTGNGEILDMIEEGKGIEFIEESANSTSLSDMIQQAND